ncbi:hypothetical protein BP6252_13136 [Coleophoma cylindrospora]|uniref:Uncharacterized protein n=1 Tax=Coleophoma cylindrospora TaxID=1849047 RepID=A0A3D8QAG2_9HELO|nr:hypothetical protein BP6252_13136 [Coleophoma cylindrospora]
MTPCLNTPETTPHGPKLITSACLLHPVTQLEAFTSRAEPGEPPQPPARPVAPAHSCPLAGPGSHAAQALGTGRTPNRMAQLISVCAT